MILTSNDIMLYRISGLTSNACLSSLWWGGIARKMAFDDINGE